ncbi:MAG: hypothetical protein QW594_00995 [Candidatus Woesearchaeota archaeon]
MDGKTKNQERTQQNRLKNTGRETDAPTNRKKNHEQKIPSGNDGDNSSHYRLHYHDDDRIRLLRAVSDKKHGKAGAKTQ